MKKLSLSKREYLKYLVISYVLSFIVLYLFYYSKLLASIASIFLSKILFGELKEKKDLDEKKKESDNIIFLLESLSTSLRSGSNTIDSFIELEKDMKNVIDGEIYQEIKDINMKVSNNQNMKDVLEEFKKQMNNQYIDLLIDTYNITYELGGNLVDGIDQVLEEVKSDIEYENILAEQAESGFNQLLIMTFLPIIVSLSLRSMGEIYTSLSLANIALKTFVMFLSIASFKWGKKLIRKDS